jgi:enoyl-CoA hydratase/carnithine racemase
MPPVPTPYPNISPPFKDIHLTLAAPSIAVITISRPGKNNAFTNDMEVDLVRAFGILDKDDGIKAIVVTGEGKIFCAGADLFGGVLDRRNGESAKEHRDQ